MSKIEEDLALVELTVKKVELQFNNVDAINSKIATLLGFNATVLSIFALNRNISVFWIVGMTLLLVSLVLFALSFNIQTYTGISDFDGTIELLSTKSKDKEKLKNIVDSLKTTFTENRQIIQQIQLKTNFGIFIMIIGVIVFVYGIAN